MLFILSGSYTELIKLFKEQKKKEEINNFCGFKDSSIFNLDFGVDNFIQ